MDELLDEADAAPLDGWDFSWLEGRATEERPSWGYQRLIGERLARSRAALDIQTGAGEVLAGVEQFPAAMAATESWPANLARATRLLTPRGVVVVAAPDDQRLPFGDSAFDLVISRHPVTAPWMEIARVLRRGGTYVGQHVGPGSAFELVEFLLGPQPAHVWRRRHPDDERVKVEAAGLVIVDLRMERLRMEFFDVGAVVYLLRKVIWIVPDFSVDRYRDRLETLHERITREGAFVAHSTRYLIEARKPAHAAVGV